jgi:hypothetical protein
MHGLTIGWQYITGRCVATDPATRQRAEWPPHPGRVFMALAATWFETGEDREEGDALRWIEKLGDPQIALPPGGSAFRRDVVLHYVPVNDTEPSSIDANKSAKQMARLTDSELADVAVEISASIDKSAKTAIGIPTALRIELLGRIGGQPSLEHLRNDLRKKISGVEYNDFIFDAIGALPQF